MAKVAPSYESILRDSMTESGRPLHPAFEHALDENWVDATAADFEKENGEIMSARERTMMNAISYYTIEGFTSTLTPLGYLMLADAMLTFLSITEEEVEHGFQGVEADPWREVRRLPVKAREEFGRALWHVHEALKLMGLDDLGQPVAVPRRGEEDGS
jgi:hypothetical protein